MLDIIPAVIAFVLFAAFTGWLAIAIGEVRLLIVSALVIAMAGLAFWREVRSG
jgi:hypothetical protein